MSIDQRGFVVDERAYCICDHDLPALNLQFLNSVDPTYFHYLAEIHRQAFTINDETAQLHASIALRIAYSQGLETLFAFTFAALQAPDRVAAWLLKYEVKDIKTLVEKVKNRKPILSFLAPAYLSWDEISSAIFDYNEKERAKELSKLHSRLWQSFASDYLKDNFNLEYNNLKHGLRVQAGGFYLAMGAEKTPGVPATHMTIMTTSKYGSSFFVPEPIKNVHKRHFKVKHVSRNWHVERYIFGLELISLSLENVIGFLQIRNGTEASSVNFTGPSDHELLNQFYKAHSSPEFSTGSFIEGADIKPMEIDEIKNQYPPLPKDEDFIKGWRPKPA